MIDGHRGQSTASGTEDAAVEDQAVPTPEPGPPARRRPGHRSVTSARVSQSVPAWHDIGVTANEVTVVGMVLAAVTGVVIGLGHFWIAAALLTVGGLMDTLDGAVAKAAGTSSKKGAFFDSVADRVSDALIFGGVAWYFASGSQPAAGPVAVRDLRRQRGHLLRAGKGGVLGYDAKGGLMERAERLIFLGVALLLHVVFVPLLSRVAGPDGLHRCPALREGLAPGEPGGRELCVGRGPGVVAASSLAVAGVASATRRRHQASRNDARAAYAPGAAANPSASGSAVCSPASAPARAAWVSGRSAAASGIGSTRRRHPGADS